MKLALYGGSFDPPHIGHLRVVTEALAKLPIERLIIVPAFRNPFKPNVRADSSTRYRWLRSIFSSFEKVDISDFEITQKRSVYTIETVKHFLPMCDELYLIIGADNLEKLASWHRFDELNTLVRWVVATRGEIPIPANMIALNVDEKISSSDFRNSFSSLGLEPSLENEILTYYKELYESTN
ncbi:MAG: nicotinate (nicotinamide) nucleotide adenylyltransferase [Sulfuricurvum sp.]|uniref:nicotinate (nicotinamide) nucleotide adenylyltransferase n=1 Tax=Sulfuricurvum sp. TaxID=2025608 RepID=UPI002623C532|nr:nicotinate (nicotinamide) nucleotide adenylyltransferase [Sulfuricurvum sp.]MDD2838318.1 nicotinate (nicotinamide) nucleotide adenylyltransferase [Sulfuricurvum sp.]MDD3597711.1 nicotinate (nicotinamide) nucleotide adenylyltransferase [Sulfuricurvum sp.]MDD4884195.1 nicotinate (nicotinamide) nucleotide adenylyltransferase [Sulfuricurvum sp.]